MAKKTATGASTSEQVTVAEVIKTLEFIEWYCRHARLMLRQLDKKTPIKLTRELKAMIKAAPPNPTSSVC